MSTNRSYLVYFLQWQRRNNDILLNINLEMRGTKSVDGKLFAMINTQFSSIIFINVSISGLLYPWRLKIWGMSLLVCLQWLHLFMFYFFLNLSDKVLELNFIFYCNYPFIINAFRFMNLVQAVSYMKKCSEALF